MNPALLLLMLADDELRAAAVVAAAIESFTFTVQLELDLTFTL